MDSQQSSRFIMSDEEVAVLNRKMDKVLSILNNDGDTGRKGLVAEVADIRNIVVTHVAKYNLDKAEKAGKDKVWRIVWGAVGAALLWIGKAIAGAIASLFTHV